MMLSTTICVKLWTCNHFWWNIKHKEDQKHWIPKTRKTVFSETLVIFIFWNIIGPCSKGCFLFVINLLWNPNQHYLQICYATVWVLCWDGNVSRHHATVLRCQIMGWGCSKYSFSSKKTMDEIEKGSSIATVSFFTIILFYKIYIKMKCYGSYG